MEVIQLLDQGFAQWATIVQKKQPFLSKPLKDNTLQAQEQVLPKCVLLVRLQWVTNQLLAQLALMGTNAKTEELPPQLFALLVPIEQ